MPSFDVVSKVDLQEIDNAVNSVKREITQRYDFKNSNSSIDIKEEEITIIADDDYKLSAITDMLKVHVTKRNLDARSLDFQTTSKASGNAIRQVVKVKQGIESEIAKKIVKDIKAEKFKVQASIRGEELRVEGKKRDDLQEVINFLKQQKLDLPLQFINFRD
ncbi:MAG: YajQ family cyclic di-GMP-binding protein [Alphaproteobacteria bacterium]